MFSRFIERLTGSQAEPKKVENGSVVFAALLVRIARADGVFDHNERQSILQSLQGRYNLDEPQAQNLLAEGETLESSAQDTQHFTSRIKSDVPLDDRFEIMVCVWSTVLADGERAPEEDAAARLIAPLLGLDDVTSAKARQQAQREN